MAGRETGEGDVDEPFEISCKMYLKRVTEIALFQLQIRRVSGERNSSRQQTPQAISRVKAFIIVLSYLPGPFPSFPASRLACVIRTVKS